MNNRGFWLLIGAGVVHAAVVAAIAPGLPARVPTHFGPSGAADSWSSRTEALWMFGLMGGGTLAFFLLLAFVMDKLPTSMLNVPNKDWWTATPEREALMRVRMNHDMNIFGAATVFLMSLITVDAARAADMADPQIGWLAIGGLLGYLLFTVGYVIWMFVRRFPRGAQ